MATPQKKKLEDEMLAEQIRRNEERQRQMQREIEEERRKLAEIERRAKEEAEKRLREKDLEIERLKKQREEEQRERELLERQRRELEEARDEALRKLKLEQLEAQRKAQEQRDKELEAEVERRLEERRKAEELQKAQSEAITKLMEAKREELKMKEFIMSRIAQENALVTLSVRYSNKIIAVTWGLGKDYKAAPNDWIGFYKVGQRNEKYREYIKTNGERKGSHNFTAPKTPGLYIFKYFSAGTYNEVACSDVIHIGPQLSLNASLVPAQSAQNKKWTIELQCTLNAGELTTSDWVGLYAASEKSNRRYIAMKYLAPMKVGESMVLTFDAPRTPGDYVFRFFPSRCRYTHVATSNRVRVENRDALHVETVRDDKTGRIVKLRVRAVIHSVDPNVSDYVAVYRIDAPNNSYVSYAYYDHSRPFIEIPPPTAIGSYEVRFHSALQSKYADVCRSSTFHVENTDWVKAEVTPGLVAVSWDIHSQPKSTWDWVGIFRVGASNHQYVSYKYVLPDSSALVRSNSIRVVAMLAHTHPQTFDAPKEPGDYEVRYFSYHVGTYADFRKSAPFKIA